VWGGGDADGGGDGGRVRRGWAGVAIPVGEQLCHWIGVDGCRGRSNWVPPLLRNNGFIDAGV